MKHFNEFKLIFYVHEFIISENIFLQTTFCFFLDYLTVTLYIFSLFWLSKFLYLFILCILTVQWWRGWNEGFASLKSDYLCVCFFLIIHNFWEGFSLFLLVYLECHCTLINISARVQQKGFFFHLQTTIKSENLRFIFFFPFLFP